MESKKLRKLLLNRYEINRIILVDWLENILRMLEGSDTLSLPYYTWLSASAQASEAPIDDVTESKCKQLRYKSIQGNTDHHCQGAESISLHIDRCGPSLGDGYLELWNMWKL